MFLRAICLAIGISVIASASTQARETFAAAPFDMVKVTSSYPAGYNGKLVATIDDQGAGVTLFTYTDSRGTAASFTVDELHKGKVLIHALGKDILKIISPEFSNLDGGQLVLTFLKGFFGNDHREIRFDYVRVGGPTEWQMRTDDQQGREPFDGLLVVVAKTLGVPSGVGEVVLSSSDRTVRHYDPAQLPAGNLELQGLNPLLTF